MLSNYLAEIWGISITIVCLALLVKPKYLKRLFASMEDEGNLFMWGLISLVIGIATVLAHNIWMKNWQVIVTILGWLALIKGLSLLFLPEFLKKWVKKMEDKQWMPIVLVAGVFVGLIITYLGFTA
jgi:uncharacterized membrane protein